MSLGLGSIVPVFDFSIFGSGLSVAHAGFVGGYLSVAGIFQMKTTGRVMDGRMSM